MVALNQSTFVRQLRQFPGSFVVQDMTLGGLDIKEVFAQFDVYESIFSPTMTADLTFFDTQNLLKNLPILGEEDFSTSITDGVNVNSYKFRTFKPRDRVSPKPQVIKFTVALISQEGWKDSYFRLSKFYGNTLHETAVADVLSQIGSTKSLLVGGTSAPRSWTFNYWSPIHCISWLASRSQSGEQSYTNGTYVFFETCDGFTFCALENLLDSVANKPYGSLVWSPIHPLVPNQAVAYNADVPPDIMQLEEYRVSRSMDVIDNARQGMYANQVRTLDLVNKAVIDTKLNYIQAFNGGKHLLGQNGLPSQPLSTSSIEALEHPEAMYRVAVKSKGLFDDEPDGGSNIDQWLSPKMSQMQSIENFMIEATIPGHIGIKAGMIVNFSLPDPTNASIQPMTGYDPTWSGQYLITHLRRIFQRDKYWIKLLMVKDSRGSATIGNAQNSQGFAVGGV